MSRYSEDLDYLVKGFNITKDELNEIIDEADRIINEKDIDNNKLAEAYLKKTQALQKLGRYEESKEPLEKLLDIKNDMPEALVRLGNIYGEEKKYDEAIGYFNRAIKLKKYYAYAYAYCMRGNTYYDKDEYNKAIKDYIEAIMSKPDYTIVYYKIGNVYNDKGEYDRAIAYYSEAIKRKRNYAVAYYSRGNAYYNKGEYDSAISDYSEAIKIDSNYAVAYYHRGMTYYNKGEYDKAIKDYSEFIKIYPNYADAYYYRGITYYDKGEYNKAIKDHSEAIRINPNHAYAYYNRGFAYYFHEEYGKAIEASSNNPRLQDMLITDHFDEVWNFDAKLLGKMSNYFCDIIVSFKKKYKDKYKDLVNCVYDLWKELRCKNENGPKYIYQYTRFEILKDIINSRCIRLRPACYQNDPEEGKTLFTYLKKRLPKIEFLFNDIDRLNDDSDLIAFTGSLATVADSDEDALIMWNSSYADNGKGVSIGIDKRKINKGAGLPDKSKMIGETPFQEDSDKENKNEQNEKYILLEKTGLYRILYIDPEKANREELKKIIKYLNEINGKDLNDETLRKDLMELFSPISHLIKNKIWNHEKEYRLIYIGTIKDDKDLIQSCPEKGIYIETEPFLFEKDENDKDIITLGPRVEEAENKILKLKHTFLQRGLHADIILSKKKFR